MAPINMDSKTDPIVATPTYNAIIVETWPMNMAKSANINAPTIPMNVPCIVPLRISPFTIKPTIAPAIKTPNPEPNNPNIPPIMLNTMAIMKPIITAGQFITRLPPFKIK